MITGRPTKLTMERAQAIIHAIRRGNYMVTAAALAGVAESTVYEWLDRGEKALEKTPDGVDIPENDSLYIAFALGVHRAAAEVEDESVHALRTGKMLVETASGARSQITDRKGHLKFLERRYPDRWGNRKAIELSGKDGGPVQVSNVTPESLAKRIAALRSGKTLGSRSGGNDGSPAGVDPGGINSAGETGNRGGETKA